MVINNSSIYLNDNQKNFLKRFFKINNDFIETRDMLDPDNISKFAEMYLEYLKQNNLINDEVLYYFYVELKLSQLKEKSKKNKFTKIIEPASSISTRCKNNVINKWRHELKVVKVVSKTDTISLNNSIKKAIKQNKLERTASFEVARKKVVR